MEKSSLFLYLSCNMVVAYASDVDIQLSSEILSTMGELMESAHENLSS